MPSRHEQIEAAAGKVSLLIRSGHNYQSLALMGAMDALNAALTLPPDPAPEPDDSGEDVDGCAAWHEARKHEASAVDAREMAKRIVNWLSEQKYDNQDILHAAVVCDYAGRQHFIDAIARILAAEAKAAKGTPLMTTNKEHNVNIEDMTIGQAREIVSLLGGNTTKPCPFEAGKAYMIRTVTMTWTGRVRKIAGDFIILDTAAWIADTGRFHLATKIEALSEVEPVGDGVFVGLGAIVDSRPWDTALPTAVK